MGLKSLEKHPQLVRGNYQPTAFSGYQARRLRRELDPHLARQSVEKGRNPQTSALEAAFRFWRPPYFGLAGSAVAAGAAAVAAIDALALPL